MANSYYISKRKFKNIEPPIPGKENRYVNPNVDIFVGMIGTADYTGLGTRDIVAQKAQVTEDELIRGFVPAMPHLERGNGNFILGLSNGMSTPSEYNIAEAFKNSVPDPILESDTIQNLTVGDVAYVSRIRKNKESSEVKWDIKSRSSRIAFFSELGLRRESNGRFKKKETKPVANDTKSTNNDAKSTDNDAKSTDNDIQPNQY